MSHPEIDVSIAGGQQDGWTVVSVEGEIDLSTANQLREALGGAIDDGATHLAVDLRPVRFMDSMGLGVLIGARRRLTEEGGEFALVCEEGPVQRVLVISGLTEVFRVVMRPEDLGGA